MLLFAKKGFLQWMMVIPDVFDVHTQKDTQNLKQQGFEHISPCFFSIYLCWFSSTTSVHLKLLVNIPCLHVSPNSHEMVASIMFPPYLCCLSHVLHQDFLLIERTCLLLITAMLQWLTTKTSLNSIPVYSHMFRRIPRIFPLTISHFMVKPSFFMAKPPVCIVKHRVKPSLRSVP